MRRARRIAAWAALALLVPAAAWAVVPAVMHFQGVLTGDDGLPVTGTVPMVFRIYADTTAAPIWSATKPAVSVTNGWYEADLDVGALPFDEPYFLGIEVSGTPLGPKKPLASVPYSMRSAHTRVSVGPGLSGTSDSAGVRIEIADLGVGTAKLAPNAVTGPKIAPGAIDAGKIDNLAVVTEKLNDGAVTSAKIADDQLVRSINGVRDNVYLEAGNNVTVTTEDSAIRISAVASGSVADEDWEVAGANMYAIPGGNVGIGTTTPIAKLEVKDGNARITNGKLIVAIDGGNPPLEVSSSALVPNLNADRLDGYHAADFALLLHEHDASQITSGIFPAARLPIGAAAGTIAAGDHTHPGGDGDWTVNATDMYSAVSGNVGIGTSSPTRKLDVVGGMGLEGGIYAHDGAGVGLRDDAGNLGVWVRDGGRVGIGMDMPQKTLEVNGDVGVAGKLLIGGDDPSNSDTLGMDDEAELLIWNEAGDRFEFTNAMVLRGPISAGDFANQIAPLPFNHFTFGTVVNPSSSQMNASGDVYVQFDFETGDQAFVGHDLSVGLASSLDNDSILFDQGGQELVWDNSQVRFELSSDLILGGTLAAGFPSMPAALATNYNYFASTVSPAPAGGDMATGGDLYVGFDIEAGSDLYYSGNLVHVATMAKAVGATSEDLETERAAGALAGLRPRIIRTPDPEEGKTGAETLEIGFDPSELPDLVTSADGSGYRPLDIVAILTKVVQEQQKTIASLEERLDALELGR